jgi:N-acetylneuraminate synthase/N,N'-diacetyllegionaminate synthase
MRIGDLEIGEQTFCIAEIGSNHNGDFAKAKELAALAVQAGADAVKFQTYRAEKYIDPSVPPMAHVRGVYKSQQERFKSLQFTPEQWAELAGYCRGLGAVFFSTPADTGSVDMLDQWVQVFKIQSGDVTNIPLIRHVAAKGKPMLMSTGMAGLDEIERAVHEVPVGRLALLHCVSMYPTPAEHVALGSIPYLRERFGLPVGYSDHSLDSLACLAAVAVGACIVERHFTDNRDQPIGDHKFSATPDMFRRMVEDIRRLETMRGSFADRLAPGELAMRHAMRRGLAATRDLPAGAILAPDMLIPMRPEKGISPHRLDDLLGKSLTRPVGAGQFLEPADVEGLDA